jgi:hypothetical protein
MQGLNPFVKNVRLADCSLSSATVAIVGPQSRAEQQREVDMH